MKITIRYSFQLGMNEKVGFQENVISDFVRILGGAIKCPDWEWDDGTRYSSDPRDILAHLTRGPKRRKPGDFADFALQTAPDCIRVILSGTVNGALPLLDDGISTVWTVDDRLAYDRTWMFEAVRACVPGEAMLIEKRSDNLVCDAREGEPVSSEVKPWYVAHSFHYFGNHLIELMGGLDHVMDTPAHKVSRVADGVVVELTQEPFDSAIPEHATVQKQATLHLGIDKFYRWKTDWWR